MFERRKNALKNILDLKNEKITEKVFLQSIIVSIISILLCIIMLCSLTYAWFSTETDSGNNVITSANFSLDVSVSETDSAAPVAIEELSDGSIKCTLAKKNTTYTVLLSMTDEANAKGYCAFKIGSDVNEVTEPMSKDAAIGKRELSFTIATSDEDAAAVVIFTPKWGYPAASTIVDGAAVVLGGTATVEEPELP